MSKQIATREEGQVVQHSPDTILGVIQRAASDPATDVVKLEKMLDMYERITAKNAEAAFNQAMAEAQAEMKTVAKDSDNQHTKSRYASYATLDKALRPIYTKHGFSLSFDTGDGAPPEHVRVQCYVAHNGGHTRTYHVDMPADGKGAKGGDVMTKTHAVGSAMQYGMRYLLKFIFNVATGEDDDGNGASVPRLTEQQVMDLEALITEVKADRARFLAYFKVSKLEDLSQAAYPDAIRALEAKRKKA